MSQTNDKAKLTARLTDLIAAVTQRGNRLEVMNGKVYEVKRRLIGEVEENGNVSIVKK